MIKWIFILGFAVCMGSCSKFEDDDASRIIGRWKWVESYSYEFVADGLPLNETHIVADKDFVLEFRKNGCIRWYEDGELRGKLKAKDFISREMSTTSEEFLGGYDIRIRYLTNDDSSEGWRNYICQNDQCMYERRFPFDSSQSDNVSYYNHFEKIE